MSTGVLSLGAARLGVAVLSVALFGFAALAAAALLLAVARRGLGTAGAGFDRFAVVAGLDVLGMKALDWHAEAVATGLVAGAVVFLFSAFKKLRPRRWSTAGGIALLLVVALESLAAIAARLSVSWGYGAALAALVLWTAGVVLYLPLVAKVGPALDPRRDPRTVTPDWWIVMGAVSIITVSGAWVFRRVDGAVAPTLLLTTWAVASAWIPLLAVAELRRSRLLEPFWRFRPSGWSAVFPLGMYALATWWVGALDDLPALEDLSQVALGLALTAWSAALIGTLSGRPIASLRVWWTAP